MLKISIMGSSRTRSTVRLEGHISGPWVEALRKACDAELTDHKRMLLDIADVSFVDRDGIRLLTELQTRRVALLNPQPFVAELLKSEAVRRGARTTKA